MNISPELCRICERWVLSTFFEQHATSCVEISQAEMNVNNCNDKLIELQHYTQSLLDVIMNVINTLVPEDIQLIEYHRAELKNYQLLLDIINTALLIKIPEHTEDDIEPYRSQEMILKVVTWESPTSDNEDTEIFIQEVENHIRAKINTVHRMLYHLDNSKRIKMEFKRKLFNSEQWSEFVSPDIEKNIPKLENPTTNSKLHQELHKTTREKLRIYGENLKKNTSKKIKDWKIKGKKLFAKKFNKNQAYTSNFVLACYSQTTDSRKSSLSNLVQLIADESPRSPLPVADNIRSTPPSIKDFEIIKPISKGAFGSVFLAKKQITGDYYAIKVLKKSDMIAKNQVSNVKAERMIMIKQNDSPFVTKLYYTFQSKEYLYLVMEYLNGGDCSSLTKVMGSLPYSWSLRYLAEVTLGIASLHKRNIIHRDLKPDNLLIDQYGHLKLTDFGLSYMGLLNRRIRNVPSNLSSRSSLYKNSIYELDNIIKHKEYNTRLNCQKINSSLFYEYTDPDIMPSEENSHKKLMMGTPDYLAPESILGTDQDTMVDWWSLGVICYEFLYGYPPFHAETPEKVFENILSRSIDWHENDVSFPPEARDFIERLLTPDPKYRLGRNGIDEVCNHPFFNSIDWENLLTETPSFIPQPMSKEDTDYFDSRGASMIQKDTEGPEKQETKRADPVTIKNNSKNPSSTQHENENQENEYDIDFGVFLYKNLPLLEKANGEALRKIQSESFFTTADNSKFLPLPLAIPNQKPTFVMENTDTESLSSSLSSTPLLATTPSIYSKTCPYIVIPPKDVAHLKPDTSKRFSIEDNNYTPKGTQSISFSKRMFEASL